ncbi:MAG TPA: hypothetical protein VFY68_07220, partial [Nitrososphaeraceae archaeon]|nr:hypothetical protein [Nitrososphaeraceae archaeon]
NLTLMYQIKWFEFFFDFYLSGEIQAISLGRFCLFEQRLIQSSAVQKLLEPLFYFGIINAFFYIKVISLGYPFSTFYNSLNCYKVYLNINIIET